LIWDHVDILKANEVVNCRDISGCDDLNHVIYNETLRTERLWSDFGEDFIKISSKPTEKTEYKMTSVTEIYEKMTILWNAFYQSNHVTDQPIEHILYIDMMSRWYVHNIKEIHQELSEY